MGEEHVYEENGIQWTRVFTIPRASVDTMVDPNSSQGFLRATNKRMTIGDMWEESERLSAKRTQKLGYDPVMDTSIKKYEKKCKGKRHPLKKQED